MVIGSTIGNFSLYARIGAGATGEVFAATHRDIGTKVAVKLLLPDLVDDRDQVARFIDEARATSAIHHAGIVKIFDVGVHADRPYLVMEYLDGESLSARIRRLRRLSLTQVADYARQIASVLEACHAAGIVHRDLKPENLFVVPDPELASGERVKLLDFGIAKVPRSQKVNATLGTVGTPTYMAPEQWQDASAVDGRADIYALGGLMFEMACGRPPFVAQRVVDLYAKHLTEAPPSVRAYAPDLPLAFDELLQALLAKDPARRPALADLSRALDAFGAPGTGPLDVTLLPISRPRRRAWPIVAAFVGAAAVAALAVVALREMGEAPAPAAAPQPALTLRAWEHAANPFVTVHGVKVQAHQITRREYRRFLDGPSHGDDATLRPAHDWDDTDPFRPVAWVSPAAATKFCEAIGAALPTTEAWATASGGAAWIDATGSGRHSTLHEWTASATAAPSAEVGFRCTRAALPIVACDRP